MVDQRSEMMEGNSRATTQAAEAVVRRRSAGQPVAPDDRGDANVNTASAQPYKTNRRPV